MGEFGHAKFELGFGPNGRWCISTVYRSGEIVCLPIFILKLSVFGWLIFDRFWSITVSLGLVQFWAFSHL